MGPFFGPDSTESFKIARTHRTLAHALFQDIFVPPPFFSYFSMRWPSEIRRPHTGDHPRPSGIRRPFNLPSDFRIFHPLIKTMAESSNNDVNDVVECPQGDDITTSDVVISLQNLLDAFPLASGLTEILLLTRGPQFPGLCEVPGSNPGRAVF